MLAAPLLLRKNLKEADHKPSLKLVELVGYQQKQKPRIPFDKTLRACRALTVWRLSSEPTIFQ